MRLSKLFILLGWRVEVMVNVIVSEKEYVLLTRRSSWKESVNNYKIEKGLEDKFMDDEEFVDVENLILNSDNLSKFVHDFAIHGNTRVLGLQERTGNGYFSALNVLSGKGLVVNEGHRSLSPKARAFLFEYGRRLYES
jgi:hypothetical protein